MSAITAVMETPKSDQAEGVERVRVIFDTTKAIRKAMRVRAANDEVSFSEVINRALLQYLSLPEEGGESGKLPGSGKRGRKPKGGEK